MNLKKLREVKTEEENILSEVMDLINVEKKSDLLSILVNILAHNEKMKQILSKVRVWLDNSRIKELEEFEKKLEKQYSSQ